MSASITIHSLEEANWKKAWSVLDWKHGSAKSNCSWRSESRKGTEVSLLVSSITGTFWIIWMWTRWPTNAWSTQAENVGLEEGRLELMSQLIYESTKTNVWKYYFYFLFTVWDVSLFEKKKPHTHISNVHFLQWKICFGFLCLMWWTENLWDFVGQKNI